MGRIVIRTGPNRRRRLDSHRAARTFRRMIFGRWRKETPREDAPEAGHADEDVEADVDVEGVPEETPDPELEWRERAEAAIPGGASTGSKRAKSLLGGEPGPTHFAAAHGCRVTTAGGVELIDCTMALGAVALGYGDERIMSAVARTLGQGAVSGLSSVLEVVLAERLCEAVPCGEQAMFFKTGGDAVSAAVRVARTHTAREHVVGCGYFGWQDWSSDSAGVPGGVRNAFTRVPFDDVAALERACSEAGPRLAAVVLEPVIERLPSKEWLEAARRACDRAGAVLIFDEIKTGFRFRTGGYQDVAGVEPDLATFGKAMANGFPLGAVVGRAAVMQAAESTWISSTLGGEASAIAAAIAVLDAHQESDVCEDLAHIGTMMRDGVAEALRASRCTGVTIDGPPQMWLLRFDSPAREDRFLALAREEGVLFKRGAYNFPALAHDDAIITAIEAAASSAFVALREEDE